MILFISPKFLFKTYCLHEVSATHSLTIHFEVEVCYGSIISEASCHLFQAEMKTVLLEVLLYVDPPPQSFF